MTNSIINEAPANKEPHTSHTIVFAFLVGVFLYTGMVHFFTSAVFNHAPDTHSAYERFNELCPLPVHSVRQALATDAKASAIAFQCATWRDNSQVIRFAMMGFLAMLVNCSFALFEKGVSRFERVVCVRRVVLSGIAAGVFWWLYEALPTIADRVATIEGIQSGAVVVRELPAFMDLNWFFPLYPVAGFALLTVLVVKLMRFIAKETK